MPEIGERRVRPATFVVAPSDATVQSKAMADYILSGTDDQVLMNTIFTEVALSQGRILITEGTIECTDDLYPKCDFAGQGEGTIFNFTDDGCIYIRVSNISGRNFAVTGNPRPWCVGIESTLADIENVILENVKVYSTTFAGTSPAFTIRANTNTIEHCSLVSCIADDTSDHGFSIISEAGEEIHDITLRGCRAIEAGSIDHAVGFLIESVTGKDIRLIDCYSEKSWDSGFHIETVSIGILLSGCESVESGQDAGYDYGAGFIIAGNAEVTVIGCKDRGSRVNLRVGSDCIANIIGFEGYDSVGQGLYISNMTGYLFISDSVFENSGALGFYIFGHAADPVGCHIFKNVSVIDPVGVADADCQIHSVDSEDLPSMFDINLLRTRVDTTRSRGLYIYNSKHLKITGQYCTTSSTAIYAQTVEDLEISNFVISNSYNIAGGIGIRTYYPGDIVYIHSGIIKDNRTPTLMTNAIRHTGTVANTPKIRDVRVIGVTTPFRDCDTQFCYPTYPDMFMDVLAASTIHVRENEDLSAAIPLTFTIDAQPDVPRSITWELTHAQITEFDLEIAGTTAKGDDITETFTEADGWSGETGNAFAIITSVKLTARTGTGAGDTMDIGIGSKLGLSNTIRATADVFKVKKNNADYPSASYTANATYNTVDVSTGEVITNGDDFTIWYRNWRNIVD